MQHRRRQAVFQAAKRAFNARKAAHGSAGQTAEVR